MKKKVRWSKTLILIIVSILVLVQVGSIVTFAESKNSSKVITIEEALVMARKNNLSTKYTQLNKEKLSNNIGNLLTSLNNSAYYVTQAIELENTRLELINRLGEENLSPVETSSLQAQLLQIENLLSSTHSMDSTTNQLLDSLEQTRITQQILYDNEEIESYRNDFNIENQYISLLTLDRNIDKLEKNLELTRKVLEVERTKKVIGLSNVVDLEDTFFRFNQINNHVAQLKLQRQVVYNNYKKLLGINEEIDLILEPIEFTGAKVTNYSQGLNNALSGISVRSAEEEVKRRETHLRNVIDRYPEGTTRDYNPQMELREARYKLEDLKNNIELSYKAAYNDLLQKESELRLLEQNYKKSEQVYDISKLRYDLGMISNLELSSRKIDLDISELDLKNAKDEYLRSYKMYEYVQKGIIVNR